MPPVSPDLSSHSGTAAALKGEVQVPGDKSLCHRAIMFSAIAEGSTVIRCDSLGRDNLASYRIMQQLGVQLSAKLTPTIFKIAEEEGCKNIELASAAHCEISVLGKGLEGLRESSAELNCGNSGTTARLFCGLLAGRPFTSRLKGDASLSRRPFKRVMEPLSQMGARFSGEKLPFAISGGKLKGINYNSPIASAQVKSAIILAGLQTDEDLSVREPFRSRDHTERMFAAMGCNLKESSGADGSWTVTLSGPRLKGGQKNLKALGELSVPGDFSAAAFFVVAASIIPGSQITLRNICFNPTRIGLYDILIRMGAKISVVNARTQAGEEVVDLEISSADLRGTEVGERDVVNGIDEIPILAVAAAMASGTTKITGARELRVKESDRISMMAELLTAFGVKVEELEDGMIVHGGTKLNPASVHEAAHNKWRESGDHRIAMCGAVLEYATSGQIHLAEREAVETSFPSFLEQFEALHRA